MKAGSSNPRRFSYEDLWETHPCQLWRNSLLEQKPNVSLHEYECVCVCVCVYALGLRFMLMSFAHSVGRQMCVAARSGFLFGQVWTAKYRIGLFCLVFSLVLSVKLRNDWPRHCQRLAQNNAK